MKSLSDVVENDTLARTILNGIEDEIAKRADAIYEKHIEEMKKELSQTRSEVVAQAALRMAKRSSIQYLQDRIVIEILDRRQDG